MPSETVNWDDVASVTRQAEEAGGTIGVAIVAPSGDRFSYNGERKFGAASTVKIPLMIEIFRQIDRGERSLDDEYVLKAEDIAIGSGVMLHLHHGMTFTLNDLIYLMISISDNTATNILIDMAGMDAVNATMRSLGMNDSNLGRKMKGRPAQGDEQENWSTPEDYVKAVQALLAGTAASAGSCQKMLSDAREAAELSAHCSLFAGRQRHSLGLEDRQRQRCYQRCGFHHDRGRNARPGGLL